MNSGDTHIDVNHGSSIIPLLLHPKPSSSVLSDELRHFRISLKWCALDHTTCAGKLVSYAAFLLLAVVVPAVSSVALRSPSGDDPLSVNKVVQIPESGLAAVAFFTLSGFFRRYGLRDLLFLDALRHDSAYIRGRYARELDRAFRYLAFILLPSFFAELAHKIIFFSKIEVLYVGAGSPLMLVAVVGSWVYRTGVFLLVCVLFRLTCELQILRFEGLHKMFDGCESDAGAIFEEHMRIKKQLSATSHRYRMFIIASMFVITVSQFGALLLLLSPKMNTNFFNSGDLVVCSAVQLSGFLLGLVGAARITHRAQGIAAIATRWHMLVTRDHRKGTLVHDVGADQNDGSDSSSDVFVTLPSSPHHSTLGYFHTRQALVSYLERNNGGITLFGFALDRGLLHTLFAFEFSLVLWILSKVVVLS